MLASDRSWSTPSRVRQSYRSLDRLGLGDSSELKNSPETWAIVFRIQTLVFEPTGCARTAPFPARGPSSARVSRASDGPVTNGEHAHDALIVIELVDVPVGADSKRPQPAKSSPERATCLRFPFEETECLDNGVGQPPVKIDDLVAGSPSELDSAHLRRSDCRSRRSSSSVAVSPRPTSRRPSSTAASVSGSDRISAVSSNASYSSTGTRTAAGRPWRVMMTCSRRSAT